jgi:hypothetical protein
MNAKQQRNAKTFAGKTFDEPNMPKNYQVIRKILLA